MRRPLSISVAGGILIVTGMFAIAIGLLLLVVVLANADQGNLPDYVDALPEGFAAPAIVIGLLILAYGGGQTIAGIQAVRARGWARSAGISLAVIGALVLGLAMFAPARQSGGVVPVIFAPVIVALVFAAAALATETRWFALGSMRAEDSE